MTGIGSLRYVGCASLLALSMLALGCSSFKGSMQNLTIDTAPKAAEISVNGKVVGLSPVTTQVRCDKKITILASKEGFEPSIRTVGIQISPTGFADAVGAAVCLFPGIGLLTPGAWCLDVEYVLIMLEPEGAPVEASP